MTSYSGKIIRKTPVTPTQTSASGVWTTADAAAAVKNNLWPVPGVPDPISRSVRFRSSASAYFSKTLVTPTNNKIWTWSSWVKKGTLTSDMYLVAANGTSAYEFIKLSNSSTDNFEYAYWNGSAYAYQLRSTLVLRDPSAWYHIVLSVDTTQATAANRVRMYVNNVEVTSFSISSYPSQNTNTQINSAIATRIGGGFASAYFDGYLTEVNFIDGQQLTPSSFGTTNAFTGAWIPMPYTGTYGANGFYLNFKDTTSTTTLGYDYSGNANNWTANNISLTSGVTYDSMLDVPTSWIGYSATTDTTAVTRGNYAVLNPLNRSMSTAPSNGNLRLLSAATNSGAKATIPFPSTGLFYAEAIAGFTTNASFQQSFALVTEAFLCSSSIYGAAGAWGLYSSNAAYITRNGTVSSSLGFTMTAGDVIQLAVDMTNSRAWIGRNNVWYNSTTGTTGDPANGLNPSFTSLPADLYAFVSADNTMQMTANFGQRPFSYTPPTGFGTLCTTNLSTPTIVNGASYMAASTYTGTGANGNVISNGTNNPAGITFQPDLIWVKIRSSASSHNIADSVRGITKYLYSDRTDAEGTYTDKITSINSNGVTLGSDQTGIGSVNTVNGGTYVAWQWKAGGSAVSNTNGTLTSQVSANTTAGFSVVTYTGSGAAATVGHGLGVAPSMVIIKNRTTAASWPVYHASIGNTAAVFLNATTASTTSSTYFNNTSPTSSVFSVESATATNGSTNSMVAYCFAAVRGYSAFGSYTGNGSADGPFIYTGFRPRFVMIKRTDTANDWILMDTSRLGYNQTSTYLESNTSDAEATDSGAGSRALDILSNGFKNRDTSAAMNASGGTYIYAAFAELPFNYSNAR